MNITMFDIIGESKQDNLEEKLKAMILKGEKINVKTGGYGWTPLHCAVKKGFPNAVKFLLENKADPNLQADPGGSEINNEGNPEYKKTPIFYITEQFNDTFDKTLELLLKYKANINAIDSTGMNVLHNAILKCKDNEALWLPRVIKLIKSGADKNFSINDYFGMSPIHLAIFNCKSLNLVNALIKEGVDLSKKDALGRTPMELAKSLKLYAIEDAIKKALTPSKSQLNIHF